MVMRVPGSNVACVPIFDPDMVGSLYVPDIAKERCDQGIVKYVGPLVRWVKPGDHVLFSGYSGTLLSVEGEGKLIVMPERFLHAKVDSPDTDIPGVYFKSRDGIYFVATYEMVMELIADAFQGAKWLPRRILDKSARRETDKGSHYIFAGHADEDMVGDDLQPPEKESTNAGD